MSCTVSHVCEARSSVLLSEAKVGVVHRTGYHAVKSDKVNAPIIEEFPVVMECELLEHLKDEYVSAIVGKIVNVKAEKSVLDEKGKVDPTKLNALIFDQFRNDYYVTGEKVAKAWNAGKDLMLGK